MLLKHPGCRPAEVKRLAVIHTGTQPRQHFSRQMIEAGLAQGFAAIAEGVLTLKCDPEDLVYAIHRAPGCYCLFCGDKLFASDRGESARAHVAEKHPGAASPDPEWPHGYAVFHYWDCELNADQHARFCHAAHLERLAATGKPKSHARAKPQRRTEG